MKPWQLILAGSFILNGLVIAALFFAGSKDQISSAVAGALLPTLISSALLFIVEVNDITHHQTLQKLNIIGFFIKILLIAIWVSVLVNSEFIDKMTFIVILLINFLAWHGVEAYYWPLFMAGEREKKGDSF